MKYFRGVLIGGIIIFLIGFSFLSFSGGQRQALQSDGMHIKIHKNKITLYNNIDEIIDNYVIMEGIKECSIGDINGDKLDELAILTGYKRDEYGKEVIVFSLEDEIKEIGRKDFSEFKPWKVAMGDIDGDGIKEISVGVYKESPLHQIMAKRPFIYSFEHGELQPKWRGSRLSRPFIDYNFSDIDGDGVDEIVSTEILQDNRKVINSYKWKGFGFEGYLESESFDDIKELIVEEGLVYIHIKEGKDIYWGLLKVEDDNLEIERVD